jgi:hypothetical protein
MITLPELRAALSLDPSKDAELRLLRSQVEENFESAIGGRVIYREDFEYETELSHDQQKSITPSLLPILSIDSIEHSSDAITWEEVDLTTVGILKTFLHRRVGWKRFVRMTYTGGWTDQTTPLEVKTALSLQVEYFRSRTDAAKLTVSSQTFVGGAGVFLAADYHPYFLQVANRHKRYTLR